MIKKLLVVASLLFASSAFAGNPQGCPVPSDEELVCSVVMCDFGAALGKWSPECTHVKVRFAVYLATLGFWDHPPKCKMRDEHCNKTGKATKAQLGPQNCVDAGTKDKQDACMAAIGAAPKGYCDQFSGLDKKGCEDAQATGNFSEEYCQQLVDEKSSGRWAILSAADQQINEERYNKCLAINTDLVPSTPSTPQ